VQWVLDNRKVDNVPVEAKKTVYKADDKRRDNEFSLAQVNAAVAGKKTTLLDVRSREEYVGHPKSPRSGHIPGARFWPWDSNVDFEHGFMLKGQGELQSALAALKVSDKARPVAVYCHSGHRAAQGYLTLRSLGYEQVHLYDGSMAEYSARKKLPLQTGSQP